MTDRLAGILAAALGICLAAALLMVGSDLRRSSRTGPRWKRRLVGAGLLALALIGVPACSEKPQTGGETKESSASQRQPKPDDLAQSLRWKHLVATWREASEIASGRRGPYPFNEAGKKRILEELAAVQGDLDVLQEAELLTRAEAGLLRKDLPVLVEGVQAKRPTEMRSATCYIPLPFVPPARQSMKSLAERLALLQELAQSLKLHPEAVSKILDNIEKHLAVLEKEDMLRQLDETERAEAEALREKVKEHLARIRAHMSVGAISPTVTER